MDNKRPSLTATEPTPIATGSKFAVHRPHPGTTTNPERIAPVAPAIRRRLIPMQRDNHRHRRLRERERIGPSRRVEMQEMGIVRRMTAQRLPNPTLAKTVHRHPTAIPHHHRPSRRAAIHHLRNGREHHDPMVLRREKERMANPPREHRPRHHKIGHGTRGRQPGSQRIALKLTLAPRGCNVPNGDRMACSAQSGKPPAALPRRGSQLAQTVRAGKDRRLLWGICLAASFMDSLT